MVHLHLRTIDHGVSAGVVDFYLRKIILTRSSHLSLICLMGKGSGVDKRVLIDYNVSLLQDAVVEVFKV